MGFALGFILESLLLLANALAILNEPRFLRRHGLDIESVAGEEGLSSKKQLVMGIYTVRKFGKCGSLTRHPHPREPAPHPRRTAPRLTSLYLSIITPFELTTSSLLPSLLLPPFKP
jgi:hypothetical protein